MGVGGWRVEVGGGGKGVMDGCCARIAACAQWAVCHRLALHTTLPRYLSGAQPLLTHMPLPT